MILRSIFSQRGRLRDSYAAITEDSNTHRCSRRRTHALRAGAWKLLNIMEMCTFFLFCLNIYIIFFYLVFPKDKISSIYPDLQIQKVFTPRLLMHGLFFWSIESSVIAAHSPSVVLKMISKSYSHCCKGFKYTNILENQRICESWRIHSRQFNCSGLMNNYH